MSTHGEPLSDEWALASWLVGEGLPVYPMVSHREELPLRCSVQAWSRWVVVAWCMGPWSASAAPRSVASSTGELTLTVADDQVRSGQTLALTLTFVHHRPVATQLGAVLDLSPFILERCEPALDCTDLGPDRLGVQGHRPFDTGETRVTVVHVRVPSTASPGSTPHLESRFRFQEAGMGAPVFSDLPPVDFTVVREEADLSVSLVAGAALLGANVRYTLTVTNHGPLDSTSGTVTTTLPFLAVAIASAHCTFDEVSRSVSCPVGALGVGESTRMTFRAYYGLLTVGVLLPAIAARMESLPPDPNDANDGATVHCGAVTSLVILCP